MDHFEITLADVSIRLHTPRVISISNSFRPFLGKTGTHAADVEFQEVCQLPRLTGSPVFEHVFFKVYGEGDSFARLHQDHRMKDRPYALSRLLPGEAREIVQYLEGDRASFSSSQNCFSHIALEELLLWYDRLILHAALIDSPLGGVLFAGPSGIGKSAQADLWTRYGGARLINGDRTILAKGADGWSAYGSPYAGSSRCFVDQRCGVRAIVMLEKGCCCQAVRLPAPAAFQRLYAQTTVNTWNRAYVDRVCTLLARLTSEIPVYRLCCTPEKAAVETLRSALVEDAVYGKK